MCDTFNYFEASNWPHMVGESQFSVSTISSLLNFNLQFLHPEEDQFAAIKHSNDIWHQAKNLCSKLTQVIKLVLYICRLTHIYIFVLEGAWKNVGLFFHTRVRLGIQTYSSACRCVNLMMVCHWVNAESSKTNWWWGQGYPSDEKGEHLPKSTWFENKFLLVAVELTKTSDRVWWDDACTSYNMEPCSTYTCVYNFSSQFLKNYTVIFRLHDLWQRKTCSLGYRKSRNFSGHARRNQMALRWSSG